AHFALEGLSRTGFALLFVLAGIGDRRELRPHRPSGEQEQSCCGCGESESDHESPFLVVVRFHHRPSVSGSGITAAVSLPSTENCRPPASMRSVTPTRSTQAGADGTRARAEPSRAKHP